MAAVGFGCRLKALWSKLFVPEVVNAAIESRKKGWQTSSVLTDKRTGLGYPY